MAHTHDHGHDHSHAHGGHDHGGHDDTAAADSQHFDDVVRSFRHYRNDGMRRVARMTHDFSGLSPEHRATLKVTRTGSRTVIAADNPQSYVAKLSLMRQSVEANVTFIALLLEGVDLFHRGDADAPAVDDEHAAAAAPEPTLDSLDKAHSTLRQFVRDWGDVGLPERQRCYDPIIAEVERLFPLRLPGEVNRYRVLVPGCGLARLVWEFAHRGYSTQGNEFSYHMLLGSNWVLNHSGGMRTGSLFPYALNSANRVALADQFVQVHVPDVDTRDLPDGVDMSMNAGEFCQIYDAPEFAESFDVVAAPFFLDTAHNALMYMETIWRALRTDGVWIHMGPLLWHYTDQPGEVQIELSLAEVLDAAKAIGFELDARTPIATSYAGDRSAMMQTVYHCAFFIATKRAK